MTKAIDKNGYSATLERGGLHRCMKEQNASVPYTERTNTKITSNVLRLDGQNGFGYEVYDNRRKAVVEDSGFVYDTAEAADAARDSAVDRIRAERAKVSKITPE